MKSRIWWIVCFFFIAFPAKGQVKTLNDLRSGDWFTLEHVTFFLDTVPGDLWRNENIRRIGFKGTVIRKTKKELSISFKPTYLYRNMFNTQYKRYSVSDSYVDVPDDFNRSYSRLELKKQDFAEALKNDSLILVLRLPDGSLKDSTYILQAGWWDYPIRSVPLGIRNPHSSSSRINNHYGNYLNAKTALHNTIVGYLYQWTKNAEIKTPMPEIVHLDHHIPGLMQEKELFVYRFGWSATSLTRLTGASFVVKPNIQIIYVNNDSFPGNKLGITIHDRVYPLKKDENGTLCCRLFLSSPQKAKFGDITLLLTPGDSLHIRKKETGDYSFSGKGAGNNTYAQEEQKLMRIYRSTYDDELETRIGKVTGIYRTLWDKYQNVMNDYWLKSSQLSYKYWYITSNIGVYKSQINTNQEKYSVWETQQFTTVVPYIDYLYQPNHYDRFVQSFFHYKINQLLEDNLTNVNTFPLNTGEGDYYVQEQLFTSYPRLLLMKSSLSSIMQKNHFAGYLREFNDFMQLCNEPDIRREILNLHRQLMQLEPGSKIQELDQGLEKLPYLKNKADGYIMLNIKDKGFFWDLSWTSRLWEKIRHRGLTDRIKVIALRPGGYKESLSDSIKTSNKYLSIDHSSLKINEHLFDFFNGEFILLRNDGTIVSREVESNFINLDDVIKADMIARDQKPEQPDDAARWVLLAILATGIIVTAVAGLRVRIIRRREKNKRMIAELELKAIRSQMNPHFVFNALGSIQSLINQGKSDEANHYLVDFAKLLRKVLSSSEKKLVLLNEELEQLDVYLRLEQLRVPFTYDIATYSDVDPAGEEIPGMIIQPVVENAVIHGIAPKQSGHISIHIFKENNTLFVEVTDDGAGIAGKTLHKNGFGLRAINDRLALLNNELKTNIGLNIENRQLKEGVSGTRVTISIPV